MTVRRAQDAVALGALFRVARPAPHGVEELGARLIEAQGGIEAAIGFLVIALYRLEEHDE